MPRRVSSASRYLDERARQDRARRAQLPPVPATAPAAWGDGYREGYAQAMADVMAWVAEQAGNAEEKP